MSRDIKISLIERDEKQPRKFFDDLKLEELAESMKANGLAQPIMVRPNGDKFIIVHGERRYRAAKKLGWETIPAEVRDIEPKEAIWLSLVENIQREELSPIEEAIAFKSVLDTGISQMELSSKIGKGQSYIANKLRLLKLPGAVNFYIAHNKLTEGHARQLLRLEGMYHDVKAVTPSTEAFPDKDFFSTTEANIIWYFSVLRPEDKPLSWMEWITKDLPFFGNACVIFEKARKESGYIIPQWHIAAFWWATLAVGLTLPVELLHKVISEWYGRFKSAIVYLSFVDKHRDASMWDESMWWGYKSDLRHSRSTELIKELPNETLLAFLNEIDSFILPSSMQPHFYERATL